VAEPEFTDPALPPPQEITIKRRQTGGSDLTTVFVTLALVPFVQALVSAFGNKLADALDQASRALSGACSTDFTRLPRYQIPEPTGLWSQ
jgi:hypothetical protein